MIEHLFISKVRIKVLSLFFLDPSKDVHIRGIVRMIDEEINAVRRELRNLESAHVLMSEKRGNRVYYRVNPDSPIYYELLGLINKEFGLGGIILENLEKLGSVTFALLTSAYIENHHPSQYDVDLFIVGDVNMKGVSSVIKEAESKLKREIRYTVMNGEEFDFRKKKRDSFVMNILFKHKIMLVGNENKLLS